MNEIFHFVFHFLELFHYFWRFLCVQTGTFLWNRKDLELQLLQNWKWLVFFAIVVITDEVFSTLISVFLKQHDIKIFNFFQLNYVARHKHGLDLSKFLLWIIFWTIFLLAPKLSFSIIFWIISLNFLNKSIQFLILGVWKKVFAFFLLEQFSSNSGIE